MVLTDGCTHAVELCLRLDCVTRTEFTAYTYISMVQLMRQLNIDYSLNSDHWYTRGEYHFSGTNIWDSARRLQRNMYRSGQKQCVSFGHGKPLQLGKCGAVLLDSMAEYQILSRMRSDGRDLAISPWQDQPGFRLGYHYCPALETCQLGLDLLPKISAGITHQQYSDLRAIDFQV